MIRNKTQYSLSFIVGFEQIYYINKLLDYYVKNIPRNIFMWMLVGLFDPGKVSFQFCGYLRTTKV